MGLWKLLGTLCVAALLMSEVAVAQQSPRKIGVLINGEPSPLSDSILKNLLGDFAALGYAADKDIVIEPRFAERKLDRLPTLARELVEAKADIIFALGGPAAVAAQKATASGPPPLVPVVFAIVTDPVALKLVASMDRPGANVTGLTSLDPQQAGAQFALLKEVLPKAKRVAILSDQTIPGADQDGLAPIDRANQAAAKDAGLEPLVVKLKDAADLERAFADIVGHKADAVLVLEVPVPFGNRKQIAELALKHRMPTIFPGGQADAGGMMTYGTNVADTWRRFAGIADRIFKGAKPADLPVHVLTKRELIVNQRVAKALDVTIPADVLKRADKVVD
jgi:putative ABC transport system substrate-binding protein